MKRRMLAPAVSLLTLGLSIALPCAAEAAAINARGLSLELPDSWRQETPSSNMRLAQVAVSGSGGEGQLTIFHFGVGGGGGADANIQRWISQMELDQGSTPERQRLSVGDLSIHFVEASGTAKASRVGSFPAADQPGWRLYGAVFEGEGGPWYLRLVGPAATLEEHREGFESMLESAKID